MKKKTKQKKQPTALRETHQHCLFILWPHYDVLLLNPKDQAARERLGELH